jgi:hypothetical protein
MADRRYSKEEIARRGDEIYERLRVEMESKHYGEIVAIDVDAGFYNVAKSYQAASQPVFAKNPNAEILFVHVGRENMTRLRSPKILAVAENSRCIQS